MKKFSDKLIAGLHPKEQGKYYQREANGFAICVYPTGIKTWFFIYTIDRSRRSMSLGSYPQVSLHDAKEKYNEAWKLFKNGIDPLAEKETVKLERKLAPVITDFVDEYIDNYAKKRNRGWKEIQRALKSEIVTRWGKRKVADIKRRDLLLILDEIAARAPIMANRVLAYTRKMFSYAVKRDVIEANPFMGMEAPTPAKVRERNLTFAEIKTLWNNLDQADMSDAIRRALKLILVTGQRPGEVVGMHRGEIDESGRWWTIPGEAIYKVQAKNHTAHRVYLTDTAQSLIGDKEGYVFESPVPTISADGKKIVKPYEVQTMTHCIKANLPHTPQSKVVDKLKIAHFVPHDLRRTVTSRMAEIGILDDMIDRVQNHLLIVKSGVRKNYNHYAYDKEKQAVLEAWERKLLSIVSGSVSAKVVPMRRKTA